jgi:hypothetical protein
MRSLVGSLHLMPISGGRVGLYLHGSILQKNG